MSERVWRPMDEAPEDTLLLLAMEMNDGEPVFPGDDRDAYDIGWFEDGVWCLASKDNEPSLSMRPKLWAYLPPTRDRRRLNLLSDGERVGK